VKRLVVALSVYGLILAGCGAAPSPSSGRAYDVQVDAKATPFSISADSYFPLALQAHPGDTIRFTAVDRGAPHTVTFGTLADGAVGASDRLRKERRSRLEVPRELISLQLPPLFVPSGVSQSAAQPCFLDGGAPPLIQACPKERQAQTDFTGKSSFYNSGYLAAGAVFALRLSDDIAPGTYHYLCLLHGIDMSGQIVVVPSNQAVPAPDEVRARGAEQLNRAVGALQKQVDAAGANRDAPIGGLDSAEVPAAHATVFLPSQIEVPVGGSVTWTLFGPHTISFSAPQDAVGLLLHESDGSWTLNSRAVDPINSVDVPAPTDSPPVPRTIDSGTWDGKGFRSSGLINSVAPGIAMYRITFTQPGTYAYKCLVHADMEGRVKVGK
jgi:plastocyanin